MDQQKCDQHEEGIEIPVEQINPDTLLNMIGEFVTREWTEWGDSGCSHDDKVAQVLRQLQAHTAKVVFDLASETWNIVASKK
jgi:uncharacterized protein YheU (UPF0270 family)